MQYLTLELIKQQCRIDADYTLDDTILELYGDSAEDFLSQHLNCALDDISAENSGELPKNLINAMLIYVDYLYGASGSGEDKDVPRAFFILVAPWKKYTIA